MDKRTEVIQVDVLARVEGEGALYLDIDGGEVKEAHLRIFEPPRFFEAFLRGRDFREIPDITARICGICPIAYQMGACHAAEQIVGIHPNGPLRELRRLIYCGEWIESHVLHIYMLHAPDFLGYQSAIEMAETYPAVVERGLQMKKLGNDLMTFVGGREIHPINVKVGGFYKAPTVKAMRAWRDRLLWARDAAIETIRWTAGLDFPDFTRDYEFVSLRHPDEYPLNEGRLVSNRGLDIDITEYNDHFQEEHVAHSNALQSIHKGHGPYLVGPLARYHNNFDLLTPTCQQLAREIGLGESCNNPFQSIIVRSIEVLYAYEEALRIVENYAEPDASALDFTPRAGTGHGCTEAPRGICYHRYTTDDNGIVLDAQIVPPTSQNQKSIEGDLLHLARQSMHLSTEDLTWRCEQAIRNYDPCISCATHFLTLHIENKQDANAPTLQNPLASEPTK